MTESAGLLDPGDSDHQLRWPSKVVAAELERIIHRIQRPPKLVGVSTEHVTRLLQSAFAGESVAEQFEHYVVANFETFGSTFTSESTEWLIALSLELASWPDPPDPPEFYSQRQHPKIAADQGSKTTSRRLASTLKTLADEGLFAHTFSLWCPDEDDDEASPEDVFSDILGHRIDDFSWPPTEESVMSWTAEDLFDSLEVLDHIASWPGIWRPHDFGGCPGHPDSFSKPLGQALYRWKINGILDESQLSFRISTTGGDIGRIVKVTGESASAVIQHALEAPMGSDASRVDHAIAVFRSRNRTPESLRDAIVNLAGILEHHRSLIKSTLTSNDENDLFNIANNFDLRHHGSNQKGDYDEAFSEWIFQWYLATVTLVRHQITTLEAAQPLKSNSSQATAHNGHIS